MNRVLPILFNTEMVRAILDGRKSCTRRICKDGNEYTVPDMNFYNADRRTYAVHNYADKKHTDKLSTAERSCPICPGDILYVRETWKKAPNGYYYYEDWQKDDIADVTKWKPSIHMPKEAARIWLKVTDVRVERLQEMKPVDVIKEGAYPDCWDCLNTYGESGSQCCYGTEEQCSQCDEVMMEWEKLWNSTIKKTDLDSYGWEANQWVWVIEFERCEKPEGV
nr:MAG TPA: ASCH domain protein [Caudoviricetes sp.]